MEYVRRQLITLHAIQKHNRWFSLSKTKPKTKKKKKHTHTHQVPLDVHSRLMWFVMFSVYCFVHIGCISVYFSFGLCIACISLIYGF